MGRDGRGERGLRALLQKRRLKEGTNSGKCEESPEKSVKVGLSGEVMLMTGIQPLCKHCILQSIFRTAAPMSQCEPTLLKGVVD